MNKKIISSSLFLSLLMLTTACSNTNNEFRSNIESIEEKIRINYVNNPEIQAKGMRQIKGLINTVKPAIIGSMKQDPSGVMGMKMCATSAKDMEKQYNILLPQDSKVRRTALKFRNPDNEPDNTDRMVMEKLKTDKHFDIPLVVDMGDNYRVYKALPTDKTCLACHGESNKMTTEIKAVIHKYYPNDLAINFKEHDFRGVILSTIQK